MHFPADPSARLKTVMAIGTHPDPQLVGELVERCAVEPDFYVRDMLTWALTRHPPTRTVPALLDALQDERPQARSQALHTLSKIGDERAWPAITRELLTDADDEVARAAWRTAVGLVPEGSETELARILATQLGRGDRETMLSLSRALIGLGELIVPILQEAPDDPRVRAHVLATENLLRDPESGFAFTVQEASHGADR